VVPDVRILRNGIDVEAFRYDAAVRARVRAELGVAPGRLVVGHVGRFSWEKNHALVLSLFKELFDASTDEERPVLVLVGDGDERAATEHRARELGLTADVRFLGMRQDIAALLQGMDVLVLPSHVEGLGIVGVEAQAAGLPCVFSTGVPAEVDVTGRCRFLPVSASPARWADEVRALARLPREDTADAVLAAGYGVGDCARDLQALYLHGSRV
jgi:glycosyltransferase EpsF